MSSPLSAPTNPAALTDALHSLGISDSGATGDAWREELRTGKAIAAHLQTIAAAVTAAKQRATTALDNYKGSAPSTAEIEAAQQELLAAGSEDNPRDPGRLARAEEKLGDLLARKQRAEDKYHRDSADNVDQLSADQKSADEELSPAARAKLQQLLSSLAAAPASAMAGGAPSPAAAGAPAAGGYPGSGYTPMSDSGSDSGFTPGDSISSGDEPAITHTSSDPTRVVSQPTLTNATTSAPVGSPGTPVATAGPAVPAGQAGLGSGGFMPPMMPGMGAGGAAPHGGANRDDKASRTEAALDRDELLNGDDLLNRSVKGRL